MLTDPARTLKALGYDVDPISAPSTYPGRTPEGQAALLAADGLLELHPTTGPVQHWRVDGRTLEAVLAELRSAPMPTRHPVVAVGSNASPAQLHRKFTTPVPGAMSPPPGAVVPMAAVRVGGITVGASAHISRPGYVPATPVPDPAADSTLWVTWLDDAQLAVLDATEPNYHRVAIPAAHPVTLNGADLTGCWMYVSRHGYLADRDGAPRRLGSQAELLSGLLDDLPALAAVAGADPATIAATARGEQAVRDRIRELFRSAGLVRG